jgi:hypothetical protein
MAVYQVRLINPAINLDRTVEVADDCYILETHQEQVLYKSSLYFAKKDSEA